MCIRRVAEHEQDKGRACHGKDAVVCAAAMEHSVDGGSNKTDGCQREDHAVPGDPLFGIRLERQVTGQQCGELQDDARVDDNEDGNTDAASGKQSLQAELVLTQVDKQRDREHGQDRKQVNADRQTDQVSDQQQILLAALVIGTLIPHHHQPCDQGHKERRSRIDLRLNGIEPMRIRERECQRTNKGRTIDHQGIA